MQNLHTQNSIKALLSSNNLHNKGSGISNKETINCDVSQY